MKNFTRTFILILAFTFVLIGGINAATKTWLSTTTGGTWTTANSWSPSGVPVAGDAIIINTSIAGNFIISAVPATVFLSVTTGGTGTGTITLTGASLVDFNPGTLTINANTTLEFGTKKVLINLSASAVAVGKILTTTTLDVGFTSSGTLFTVNGTLNISSGANGPGLYTGGASRLVIANGGIMNVTGSGSTYTLYPFTINYASSSSYGTINFKGSGNWGPTTVGSNNYPIINGKLTLQGTTFFNTGFLNWGANSMLEYLQTAPVNATTVEWPAGPTNTPKSILINCGANTITTIGNNRTYSGTLTMTAGFLALGTRNLILSTPSVMTGASANSYVVTNGSGALTVNAVTTAGYTFPVGSAASDYTPLTVTPSGTTNLTVAVNSLTLSVADATQCVQKQWSVIAGTTGIIGTVAPKWNNGFPDEGTSFNHFTACDFGVWNGSAWTTSNVGIPTGTYTVSKSNLSIPTSGTNQYVVGHNLAFSCTAPAAPTGSATQSFCSAASPTVASLSASGSSIQWYDAPTNGNVLSSNTTLTNNTSYYASQTVSSCESTSRLAVAVTVNVTPNAPTPTTPQAFCSVTSPTVANLATNGASPIWYTASTGGTALATSTALTTINYYQSQTVNGCESARSTAVAVTFNTTPIAVVAAASPNPICENNTLTLTGSAMDATSWSWTGPNGFTSLSQSPTINGITTANAGIYFLTASNSCGTGGLSDNFADGNFTAFPTWTVQAGGFQSTNFLKGDNANADDRITTPNTQAYGSWQFDFTFQTTSGTTAQVIRYFTSASSTNLGTTNGYYIFLDGSGAISFRKITGGTPTVLISSTYSANTLSHTVRVTRTSANLFELFLDGSSLGTAADAAYTTTAFAGIWNTGAIVSDNHTIDNITCIPYVTTASLTVNAAPSAPAPTTPQAFCSAASPTVASLATNGASPLWYAASSGGPALATSAALTTTSYYQSQTVNGCESARSTAVVVTVNNTSAPVASAQDFCAASSPTVANLTATGTAIQWYSAASGGTALASTTALTTGTYFASQTVSGCESTSRTPVSVNVSSNPVAGTVAASVTGICTGSSSLLTLTGSDGDIQWQRSTTSSTAGFTDIAGATATTYNAENLTASTWFRAKVSKSSCAIVYTTPVYITVSGPAIAGTLSANTTVCAGTGTTLTLTGSVGTIVWQMSTNWTATTPTWTAVSGQTSSTLATGNLTSSRAYRAVLTSPCSGTSLNSNQVVVTVSPVSAVGSILGGGSKCINSTVTLSLYSYTGSVQWQEGTSATGTFTDILGATSPTYVIASLASTRYFKAVVTSGSCASVTSAVGTVTAVAQSVAGTISFTGTSAVCAGSTKSLSLSGSLGSRQWESSTDGVNYTSIVGSTGSVYVAAPTVATYYRVRLTNSVCSSVFTTPVYITVSGPAIAGTLSANTTVCTGTGTTLTLTGSVGTIVWQMSTNWTATTPTWTAVSGQTSSTLATGNLTSSIAYRAVLTSPCSGTSLNSNQVVVTVSPVSAVGSILGGGSKCINSTVTLSLYSYTGSVQWQEGTSATGTFTNILGATSPTYVIASLASTRYFKAVVTSGSCASVTSAVGTVTAVAQSVAGTISFTGTSAVCAGSTKSLSLSGSLGSRQWESSTDGVNYTSIVGSTGSVYVAAPTVATYYRVRLTNSVCSSVFTTPVYITVSGPAIAGTLSANTTVCTGTGTTLTLTGSVGTIVWQMSTNWTATTPTWTAVSGQTSSTLATGNLTSSIAYRAVLTSPCSGTSLNSNQVVVTVSPVSAVGSILGGGSKCINSTVTLSLYSYTGSVQWQEGTSATGTFTNILGATSPTYVIASLASTRYFKAVVTSGSCASVTSAVGTVTAVAQSVSGTISFTGSSTICVGTTKSLSLSGSLGSRQWESSTDGVNYTSIVGSTGSVYVAAPTVATYYRVRLTNSVCSSVYTTPVYIQVNTALGGTISGTNSVMVNTGTTLAVTGSQGTIAWQMSTNGTTWTTISGQTTSSLATGNLSESTSYRVSATVGTCFVYSPVFTVTVNSPRSSEIASTSFGAIAYPNPFADNFMLEVSSSTDEMIQVNVYDMLGKLVENHQVNVSDLSTFVIGNKFVSGVYNIEVIQGTQIERLRVVKN